MAEPLRELIMIEILNRLRAIKTSAGYTYTLQTCERRQSDLPDFPVTPAAFVYEGSERKRLNGSRLLCELEIAVVYCAESLQDQMTIGNRMLADITKAMGTDFVIVDSAGYSFDVQLFETSTEVVASQTQNQLIYVTTVYSVAYFHEHGDQTLG